MSLCLFKWKCCYCLNHTPEGWVWDQPAGQSLQLWHSLWHRLNAQWVCVHLQLFPLQQCQAELALSAVPCCQDRRVDTARAHFWSVLQETSGTPAARSIPVAASTLDHSLDSYGKIKVPHTNSCSCTENGRVFNTSLHKRSQSWSCKALGF